MAGDWNNDWNNDWDNTPPPPPPPILAKRGPSQPAHPTHGGI